MVSNLDAFRKFLTERKEATYRRLLATNYEHKENRSENRFREKVSYDELSDVLEAFDRYFPK